jgi:hypothetical protein
MTRFSEPDPAGSTPQVPPQVQMTRFSEPDPAGSFDKLNLVGRVYFVDLLLWVSHIFTCFCVLIFTLPLSVPLLPRVFFRDLLWSLFLYAIY